MRYHRLRLITADPLSLRVSSFGRLTHFTAANRPPGAADRCVACPVEASCPYSAPRLYRGLLEAQRADFDAAIKSQSRSLALRESAVALLEREKCERRTGRIAEADADAMRRKQLPTPQE